MKILYFVLCGLCGGEFCSLAAPGQINSLLQAETKLVASKWQGVNFEIPSVTRFDADTVLVEVRVSTDTSLPKPTLIGFPNPKGITINGKTYYKPLPLSLLTSVLTDRLTKQEFTAVPQPPGQLSYGPDETVSTIGPKCWFQMSVEFKLPVPPPNPDGTIPVQKVDIALPQAKEPIKAVIVPPLK